MGYLLLRCGIHCGIRWTLGTRKGWLGVGANPNPSLGRREMTRLPCQSPRSADFRPTSGGDIGGSGARGSGDATPDPARGRKETRAIAAQHRAEETGAAASQRFGRARCPER
jgi:hypothetical protein